jgi:hypothetical protein
VGAVFASVPYREAERVDGMNEAVYRQSVILPARQEQVFWDLLEPSHVAGYDSHTRTWQPRQWPPTVGTRVDFEAKMGPMWLKGVSEFVAFDPPGHLEVRQVSPPSPFRSRLTWDLVGIGNETEFTYRFVLSSPAGMGWVGARLLGVFTSHLREELPALANRYR